MKRKGYKKRKSGRKYNPLRPSKHYDQGDKVVLQMSGFGQQLQGVQSPLGVRFDSSEDASVFFARELDYVKTRAYDVLYPELTAFSIFPVSSEAGEGAQTITWYTYDKTGLAQIIANYADDLPRADVKGEPSTVYVKPLGNSYAYSVEEMRASRQAGKSLDVMKAESARYQIDSKLNRIAWAGDDEYNLMGILSTGNDIPLYTLPADGTGTATAFASKSAEQILRDINNMTKQVATNTKNVERPDTLALPTDAFMDITTRQIPGTGYTIARFLLENAPYLEQIESVAELQGDSPETNPYAPQGVAVLFKNAPDKLQFENPMPFYQHPIQQKNLELIVPCEAKTAGMLIYYPLSLLIAVGV